MICQIVSLDCIRIIPLIYVNHEVQIHNWNVRGLEMPDRKYIARRWCNVLKGKILFVYKK